MAWGRAAGNPLCWRPDDQMGDAMKKLGFLAILVFTTGCASMAGGNASVSPGSQGSDSGQLLSIDHFVRVKSAAPAMNGLRGSVVSTTKSPVVPVATNA